jgi:hypothetical protein
MNAILQLTDEEIKDLCDLTRIDNVEGAVRSALDEYRRYARRMRLKELSGQLNMEDNWRDLEKAETDADAGRRSGLHAGAWEVKPDFDAPLPDEFWMGA